MELTTDVLLKGSSWDKAIADLSPLFRSRTNYSIFMLCLAIGIMYDKRIEKPEDNGTDPHSVPRNVLQNNDNGKLDFIFQSAILSTRTESLTEEERLNLAFGEKTNYNKMSLLVQFANYGVTKLIEQIGETPVESMEHIKDFLISTVEGRNFDIDSLPDDVLLIEE